MAMGPAEDTPIASSMESDKTPIAQAEWHTANPSGTRKYTSTWSSSERLIMARSQPSFHRVR